MNLMQKTPLHADTDALSAVTIELNAAVLSVERDRLQVLTVQTGGRAEPCESLPMGTFMPRSHDTLEAGVRTWVDAQTGLSLGYAEQLCTFVGTGGVAPCATAPRVALGYLALTQPSEDDLGAACQWRDTAEHLPWEDWRDGKPLVLSEEIEPRLSRWAGSGEGATSASGSSRGERLHIAFGMDNGAWDEERVLERYDMLCEAGLVADGEVPDSKAVGNGSAGNGIAHPELGLRLPSGQRRILASAIGRLRAKIKYRPLVFELMQGEFTLFELQRTVEAILGSHLHKQNFRRLVESGRLVEATKDVRTHTGGRPAKLFRFRREVVLERPAPGVRVRPGLSSAHA